MQTKNKGIKQLKILSAKIVLICLLVGIVILSSLLIITVLNIPLWHSIQLKHGVGSEYAPAINREVREFFFSTQPHTFEAFNDEENRHMNDVRAIVQGGLALLVVCGLWFVVMIILLFRKIHNSRKSMVPGAIITQKILRFSGIACILIPILLLIVPFSPLFTSFHYLFFPQGNWMFPADSALLYYYPLGFFIDMAKYVMALVVIAGFCFLMIAWYLPEFLDLGNKFRKKFKSG